MAHKKAKTKKKKGGRKVGAVASRGFVVNDWKDVGYLALGAMGGLLVKRLGENFIANQDAIKIDPKLMHGGELVVGGAVALFVKHPIAVGAGISLAGASFIDLMVDFEVIKGIDEISPGLIRFSGAKELPRPRPNMAGMSKTESVGNTNPYFYPEPANVGNIRASAMYAGAGL